MRKKENGIFPLQFSSMRQVPTVIDTEKNHQSDVHGGFEQPILAILIYFVTEHWTLVPLQELL